MTQKHHDELLQSVDRLRMSIEALTKEIAKLNSQVVESHKDLNEKISSLADATKNLSAHVTENFLKVEVAQNNSDEKLSSLTEAIANNQSALDENFSALNESSIANHSEIKNFLITITDKLYVFADSAASDHATFDKKILRLANQVAVDNRALKEDLSNVEELLRLMTASQIMNLVDK